MSERDLVETIARGCRGGARDVVAGIGDDCAILRPRAGDELVVTTDFLIEDTHFTRATHTAADCGWKALARGLSDIAAMGAAPRWAFVSLALAEDCDARWVRDFYRGMRALADRHDVTIAGGDLTRHAKVVCDIVVLGTIKHGTALRRDKARVGDRIYVTGELGASALGLATMRGAAWRRHKRPEPRIEQGRALAQLGVKACMDISDGLALDLQRMGAASHCAAVVHDALPIARGATFTQAVAGGEDYELLFTAPARVPVPAALHNISITEIGRMVRGASGAVTDARGVAIGGGWDPFHKQ